MIARDNHEDVCPSTNPDVSGTLNLRAGSLISDNEGVLL